MSCQSLSMVGGTKDTTGDVGEAGVVSCGTFHRSVRFSSESHSSRRGSIDVFRRDSPGSTSMSVLAPAPVVPVVAFDRSAQSRASIMSCVDYSMSQSAPSAFSDAIGNITPPRTASSGGCRFPRLDECAHFHYERVSLGGISVEMVKDDYLDISLAAHSSSSEGDMPSVESGKTEGWVTLKVRSHILSGRDLDDSSENAFLQPAGPCLESSDDNFEWIVTRSADNFKMLDTMLHRCIYDRKVSGLIDLSASLCPSTIEERSDYESLISHYLHHLSIIADDSINCGPVLNWFQMDNKGHRLLVANEDTNSINTPAVAAAYSVRRYVSQARDEISFEVGDMISIIDMPGPSESIWWRGKRGFRVGFFPHHCVAVIGDKVPRHMTQPPPIVGSVAVSPIKPVLRKHGKLISLFRSFILARPSRRSLKQQGILRERVFGCDLGEHLLNSGRNVPLVLSACAALIEKHGVVDGIYRLSGATSLTQRLRRSFDDDSMAVEPPELLSSPAILHDVHAVASLIKMYFRELPNPLCTYQLYDHFVAAVQGRVAPPQGFDEEVIDQPTSDVKPDDSVKLKLMKDVVMKLPPPHYRTMSHLMRHLRRMSLMGAATGMTARNMAIVWAPNLLREPRPHRALQGVAVQAVVTEFLICYAEELFSEDQQPSTSSSIAPPVQRPECDQLHTGVEIRPGDTIGRRPKSLPLATPTKLLSLEEARNRGGANQTAQSVAPVLPSMADIELRPTVNKEPKYIEVGGGPNNLPQYHTVIELPQQGTKRGLKRSPSGWRGLFFRAKYQRPPQASAPQPQQHRPQISSPFGMGGSSLETTQSLRILDCSPKSSSLFPLNSRVTAASVGSGLASIETSAETQSVLRPVKSCESLQSESDVLGPLAAPSSNIHTGSKQHSRSASCDSYFEPWQMELAGMRLRLSPQERDGNLFSEEDDTITVSKKPQSTGNTNAAPQTTSSDTSAEQSPKITVKPTVKVETASVHAHAELGADRKRTRIEDQLVDILYIDCSTPEHSKTADPKSEPPAPDSRTKGSPEKRHSDTYEDAESSSKTNEDSSKRLCVSDDVKSVKMRERGSPRKSKPCSIRYSGLHSPLNLGTTNAKPQGKIVKIVNQLDQNVSRSSWHGNAHSTLIKIDWSGDNPSSPVTPVTPVYDILESESECGNSNSKTLNENSKGESIDSLEQVSPSNISYEALNRLSILSAASSNSTDKETTTKNTNTTTDTGDYEQLNIDTETVTVSNNTNVNDDIYECLTFARPNYINLQSSPSSKESFSPLRSTISITFKSPERKNQTYQNVEVRKSEADSLYEDIAPNDLIILESPDPIDLYSQVKCFRKSVHEVNALLENDRSYEAPNEHSYENLAFSLPPSNAYENVRYERMQVDDVAPMNVRSLANRFESPTEAKPHPFERAKALSMCEGRNAKVPCIRARSNRLSKNAANTRSLDENAFEKEFRTHSPHPDRRKSLEAVANKENERSNLKLNLNPDPYEQRYASITPTTENKISLVQARFSPKKDCKKIKDDRKESISSDTGLTSLIEESDKSKLSRERIEKYKEERRNFLREKYSSQSFRGISEINRGLPVLVKLKHCEDSAGSESDIQLRHPEKLDRLMLRDVFEKVPDSGESLSRLDRSSHRRMTPKEPDLADEAPSFAQISRKFSIDSRPRNLEDLNSRMAMSWDLSSSRKQHSLPFIRSDLTEHVKRESASTKYPSRAGGVGDRSPMGDGKPSIFSSNEKTNDKRSPSFNIKDVTAMFEQKSVMKN